MAVVISEKIHFNQLIPQKEFFDNTTNLKNNEIEMHVAQSVQHSFETKAFKISIHVVFTCEKAKFAEYLYDFIFEVDNFLDFLTEDEGKQVFEKQIVGTLVGISYSTLRGIVYSKLSDTNLNGFILPVINPNEILKFKI